MEYVAIELMLANKLAELFQIITIVSQNIENLNLEASSLENKLAT